MKTFYRYIRPVKFDEKRLELITQQTGGICLRFELLDKGDRFFTYSRCHPEDHFKKDVARRVADERAEAARTDERLLEAMRGLPDNQNTDLMVHSVIKKCRSWAPSPGTHPVIERYMSDEWKGFADALEKLHTINIAEERRGEIWKSVVNELWQSTYKELSK